MKTDLKSERSFTCSVIRESVPERRENAGERERLGRTLRIEIKASFLAQLTNEIFYAARFAPSDEESIFIMLNFKLFSICDKVQTKE